MVVGPNFSGNVFVANPSIAEDLLYIGANDGILYVLDNVTGKDRSLLKTPSRRPIIAAPAVADGVVYFGDMARNLFAWGFP